MEQLRAIPERLKRIFWAHKYQVVAFSVIALWCIPYVTSGERIEWGDFGFFAQAYEAIRITILDYHQFPWWNPWVAGGVPLYANPQIGVFSLQTPLVLLFGTIIGLKISVIIYTFLGYGAMYLLLRRYFKISIHIAVLLSLLWIFSTFFTHVPSHYTFVWYLLAPFFVYLALILKDWEGGLWLGIAFAVMALSAVHNPFFHIGIVVTIILVIRFFRSAQKKHFIYGLTTAAASFLILASHRILFAVQNVRDFPREVGDPAAAFGASLLGLVLPFSKAYDLSFVRYPRDEAAPFGFGEISSSIGIAATIVVILAVIFIIFKIHKASTLKTRLVAWRRHWISPTIVFVIALLFFVVGIGDLGPYSPYALLQHLPIVGDMRVSSRWFLGVSFCLLLFIGLVYQRSPKRSYFRATATTLLVVGTIELFLLNAGYQHNVFHKDITKPTEETRSLTFVQTKNFGSASELPNGTTIDNEVPHFFREYEATLFNTGVIQANDALIYKTPLDQTPLCGWEDNCGFIRSKNAEVTFWSPNKVILKRTDSGPITLNINHSSYFLINGQRDITRDVAEPYELFVINDQSEEITIEVKPALLNR